MPAQEAKRRSPTRRTGPFDRPGEDGTVPQKFKLLPPINREPTRGSLQEENCFLGAPGRIHVRGGSSYFGSSQAGLPSRNCPSGVSTGRVGGVLHLNFAQDRDPKDELPSGPPQGRILAKAILVFAPGSGFWPGFLPKAV